MRNTGSHISNNTYHSNEIRGGEKKVMKKSLSVILSTTMALSAFSTAALAATSKDFSDLDKLSAADKVIFDKLIQDGIFLGVGEGKFGVDEAMKRDQFAVAIVKAFGLTADATTSSFPDVKADAPELRFIEAAYKAGIANGNKDGTFNPKGEVSVQELAVFLVGALGPKYKEEARAATGNHEGVAPWAQGYVTTALKYNLLAVDVEEGFDGFAAATRYQLAKGVAAAQAKYAEDNKPAEATKVESVTSTNLKEIEVKFDGPVEKASAEDKDRYSVDASVELESAQLLEDGQTVRLTVKEDSNRNVLQNQKTYRLSVSNVRSGDKFISATDVAFTSIDNTLPEVVEVRSLGTKAIKVTFNKPVKNTSSSNFKLDGNSFYGSTTQGTRTVILKPYNAGISVGTHTLEVSGVEDYREFKALSKEFSFEVVEDTTPPTVKEVSATFEKVTVTFSEEVDPDTVLKSNIYWKSGSDKKHPDAINEISPEVFEFEFNSNPLPGYEMALYVEGVKDYSGNTITETEVRVKAEVDTVRPEVTYAAIDKVDNRFINIKFSKTVKIEDLKHFTLTKSNGDVVSLRNVKGANNYTTDKSFTIEAYDQLKDDYTLKIVGVRDTTKLQNVMNDYSVKLSGKDTTNPEYVSNSAAANGRTLIISFNKKMDLATLADKKNYLVRINGKDQQLPEYTEVDPILDGKGVRIVFPEYIDKKRVSFTGGNGELQISHFSVLAVRDLQGNPLTNFASWVEVNTAKATVKSAKIEEKGIVKVEFDQPIKSARAYDFELEGVNGNKGNAYISDAVADGTSVVTVKLSNTSDTGFYGVDGNGNFHELELYISANNGLKTTTENEVERAKVKFAVANKMRPVVKVTTSDNRLNASGNVIELPFSEPLKQGALVADYKTDINVTYAKNGDPLSSENYSTTIDPLRPNVILINLNIATTEDFRVGVRENPIYIRSAQGENVAKSSGTYLTRYGGVNNPAVPSITGYNLRPGSVAGTVAIDYVTTNVVKVDVGAQQNRPLPGTIYAGSGANLVNGGDITAAVGQYVNLSELDANNKIVKFESIKVESAPAIAGATLTKGVTPGTVKINYTAKAGNFIGYAVNPAGAPLAGTTFGGSGATHYVPGSEISGVAAGNTIGVYEFNSTSGKVVGYVSLQVTDVTTLAPAANATFAPSTTAIGATTASHNVPAGFGSLAYKVSPTVIPTPEVGSTVSGATPYTSGANITATAGQYIGIYVLDVTGKVVMFDNHLVQAGDLGVAADAIQVTKAQGTNAGETAISFTAKAGSTYKYVKSSAPVNAPIKGSNEPASLTGISSGESIAVNADEHVIIYEIDANGKVTGFVDVLINATDIK